MQEPIKIGQSKSASIFIQPSMANRHGLIVGATGSGKSVTLQLLAEKFSNIGVPVFMPNVKGDLTGVSQAGVLSPELLRKLETRRLDPPAPRAMPTMLWDIFGFQGASIGTTPGLVGSLLLSQMLDLNEVQSTIMSACFKIAEERKESLQTLDEVKSMLGRMERDGERYIEVIGRIPASTLGAIRRSIFNFEMQGGTAIFQDPTFDIGSILAVDDKKNGIVNVLAAEKIISHPKLYSVFMFWLLRAIYERLPEQAEGTQPKLIFLFDEAHLLFRDAPKLFVDQIEFVVRMARSRGVCVFFITQQPRDIPDQITSQLGNKIYHSLRANSPTDLAAISSIARSLPSRSGAGYEQVIPNLEIGEAIFCLLDSSGRPGATEQGFVMLPGSKIGGLREHERVALEARCIASHPRPQIKSTVSNHHLVKAHDKRSIPTKAVGPSAQPGNRKAPPPQWKRGAIQFLTELGKLVFAGILAMIRILTKLLHESGRPKRGSRKKR